MENIPYIGRFAPSPSGPLHLGSLATALASYLQAKSHDGKWLLRIEDIDPPREVLGASADIQQCLVAHGLFWDDPIVFQSQRSAYYQKALIQLEKQAMLYQCDCTRKRIKSLGGIYDGFCRAHDKSKIDTATRFLNLHPICAYDDVLLGSLQSVGANAEEDFVVKRKDQLWAYQLAVVVDDYFQGITQVVRGSDLVEPTFLQLTLFNALNWSPPDYLHVPVLSTQAGQKLSKQNHAPRVDNSKPIENLLQCLAYLRQPKPIDVHDLQSILKFAIKHWTLHPLKNLKEVII